MRFSTMKLFNCFLPITAILFLSIGRGHAATEMISWDADQTAVVDRSSKDLPETVYFTESIDTTKYLVDASIRITQVDLPSLSFKNPKCVVVPFAESFEAEIEIVKTKEDNNLDWKCHD